MGKNKARHLLHGILDLLPLFVIPIFAIYTRNENYNSNIEIQVQENIEVNFNQYRPNEFNEGTLEPTYQYQSMDRTTLPISYGHKYYVSLEIKSSTNNVNMWLRLGSTTQNEYIFMINNISTEFTFVNYQATLNYVSNNNDYLYFMQPSTNYNTIYYRNLMCIDLTQMFGEGNEPSNSQFREMYPQVYYDYTPNHTELLTNQTITYNDTDVGSQFVYTLYNTVDKYFNMGNVFNMNGLYDWFVLNIFGGNASISVYIVWNIVLYEFVMDLLFLLYGLFMFFIDMCKRLMEKPLNSIK